MSSPAWSSSSSSTRDTEIVQHTVSTSIPRSSSQSPVRDTDIIQNFVLTSITQSSSQSPMRDTEIVQHMGSMSTTPSFSKSPVHDTEIVQHIGPIMSTIPSSSQLPMRTEFLQLRRSTSSSSSSSHMPMHHTVNIQKPSKIARFKENFEGWGNPLNKAFTERDQNAIKKILEKNPKAINCRVGEDKDTPLVVAIREGLGMDIIEKLLELTPDENVAATSPFGASAIEWAILEDNLPVLKLLIDRHPSLANDRNTRMLSGKFNTTMRSLPVEFAASQGLRNMTYYLHQKTDWSVIVDVDKPDLLQCAVASGLFDFAMHLLEEGPRRWKYMLALEVLVEQSYAFPSGTQLNWLQSLIFSGLPMIYKTRDSKMANLLQVWPAINYIHESKLQQNEVLGFVSSLCKNIKRLDKENLSSVVGHRFISAVQNGIVEIVQEIIQRFPDAINYGDDNGNYAFQVAAMYRHEKVFNALYQRIRHPERHRMEHQNNDGNNILHLVSKRVRRSQVNATSKVVLKMQRELQWYKELEKLVPFQLRYQKNNDGKIPLEVFDEDHQDMLASEGEWMRSMANSCIVGGSLIAAVVFAAAITVPGDTNDDGLPNFSKNGAFKVFAFSNTFALSFSLTAVVIFLSIFTTRYSANDFLRGLPNRLIFGLISLLLSVTSMMVAFVATVHIMFSKDNPEIIIPTIVVACIPVFFLTYSQLPSLLNMIKCTYGPCILKHKGKILNNSSFL